MIKLSRGLILCILGEQRASAGDGQSGVQGTQDSKTQATAVMLVSTAVAIMMQYP